MDGNNQLVINEEQTKIVSNIYSVYIEEDHKSIIELEIWECVQLKVKRRKQYIQNHFLYSYSTNPETNSFNGKIICGK